MVKIDILPKKWYNNIRQYCQSFKFALGRGQKMLTTLAIFGCIAAVIMTFAYIEKVIQLDKLQANNTKQLDRCQADSSMKQDELNAQYHVLYDNVERTHGYCSAHRAARQSDGYEAQMYKLEPIVAPKETKSIEVF